MFSILTCQENSSECCIRAPHHLIQKSFIKKNVIIKACSKRGTLSLNQQHNHYGSQYGGFINTLNYYIMQLYIPLLFIFLKALLVGCRSTCMSMFVDVLFTEAQKQNKGCYPSTEECGTRERAQQCLLFQRTGVEFSVPTSSSSYTFCNSTSGDLTSSFFSCAAH